jgi:hypothetical protein
MNPQHFWWLHRKTGVELTINFRAIGLVDAEDVQLCQECGTSHPTIKGMVGYSDWTPTGVAMHVALDIRAIPKADRREALAALTKAAFDYPFKQCKRKYAVGFTRASNAAALRLARGLGFREVYRIKDGWETGEDVVVSRKEADDAEG